MPRRARTGRVAFAIGLAGLALGVAAGVGLSHAVAAPTGIGAGAELAAEREALDLVRMRARGGEPIVIVARDADLRARIAGLAGGHPSIVVRRDLPAGDDADRPAFQRGRVFVLEPANTPALKQAVADIEARGWGLNRGMAFDAVPRERIAVLQVSSPPAAELLWVPPGAAAVERHFWIDGTTSVAFQVQVGPEHDAVTTAVRQHLESRGWAPSDWERLNPLHATSLATGWRITSGGLLPEGYDPTRDGPLPVGGQWIGEWRDASGNAIDYRFLGDGRHGRGYGVYRPADVVAEMSERLREDRHVRPRRVAAVSRDGVRVPFTAHGAIVVLADPASLAARRDQILARSAGIWRHLAERLRDGAAPHRIAIRELGPSDGVDTFRIGADDVEPVHAGEPQTGVVDASTGVLVAAGLECVPKLAAVLTPARARAVLDSPDADAAARQLLDDVGRGCFAIVRATPGTRFAGNGVYRLRPGAPSRLGRVAEPRSSTRRF